MHGAHQQRGRHQGVLPAAAAAAAAAAGLAVAAAAAVAGGHRGYLFAGLVTVDQPVERGSRMT